MEYGPTMSLDRRVWIETDRPEEKIALSEPLPGVALLSAKRSNRHCNEYHDTFKLCLIHPRQQGVGAAYRCRGEHEVASGELMAFEPGDHHLTTRVGNKKLDYSVISFAPEVLNEAASELGVRGEFHYRAARVEQPAVASAMLNFVQSTARGDSRLTLEAHRDALLEAVINRCGEKAPSRPRRLPVPHHGVRKVFRYLCERYAEPTNLKLLAEMAGTSEHYLSHVFKDNYGIAPLAFRALRRLSEAQRRLAHDTPIADVALGLDYADTAHLTRLFKRQYGAPPGRWRTGLDQNRSLDQSQDWRRRIRR